MKEELRQTGRTECMLVKALGEMAHADAGDTVLIYAHTHEYAGQLASRLVECTVHFGYKAHYETSHKVVVADSHGMWLRYIFKGWKCSRKGRRVPIYIDHFVLEGGGA